MKSLPKALLGAAIAMHAMLAEQGRSRPRKKRGPLNRYVEAQKQAETIESHVSADSSSQYGLEMLAPEHVVRQIIDDWFELVHSVAPLLHRAWFLRRLAAGDAKRDRDFCNLVVSICAATVASLKVKSASYGYITVQTCWELIEHNGSHLTRGFTLEWCQMKYNMAVAIYSEDGIDVPLPYLLISESLTGVKYMLYYQAKQLSFVSQQLLKRLYWLIFAGECTHGLHGRPCIGVLAANDNIEVLRPLELTDNELSPVTEDTRDIADNWRGNTKSYIPGLNHLSRLYMLWLNSQQESDRSASRLWEYVKLLHDAPNHFPPELRWRGGLSRPTTGNFGTDVQTVNLYITQIHIRSFLIDQIDRLTNERDQPLSLSTNSTAVLGARSLVGSTSPEITIERHRLIDDMLAIAYQMPEDTLVANGHSLIIKLRDIGLSLLQEAKNPADAMANLDRLLAKLERLDPRPGIEVGSGSQQDYQTSPLSSM